MAEREEFKLPHRMIHLKCLLQVTRNVTVIEILRYNDEPTYIKVPKGTRATLIDDRQGFCANDRWGGSGPTVRIEETKGVGLPDKYIGRLVIIPSRFLKIHPQAL